MSKRIDIEVLDTGGAAYVSERKVYPREVAGPLNRLRVAGVFVLLGIYYAFPWLRWDGRQAVLFDLPARKFHIFAVTFWPQDFIFLAMLLIICALGLFFVTALAGRVWCGYACPQTVWTEVFLWMERWTEGDRLHQMKLAAGPWTREKLLRKSAKHFLWLLFALWTGFTFVGFFTPIADLAARIWPFQWGGWETFWVLFYGLATWGNAGFLREQVCKYMCPYARFQSAMFDSNTLIIAYDPMRGEPRGPRKRGLGDVMERARGLLDLTAAYDYVFRASEHPSAAAKAAQAHGTITLAGAGVISEPLPKFPPEDLGDCIDCTLCVQVCPTGIDIRNGLQYECIACGACIDACNSVMEKMDFAKGLIRYSTQNAIDGKPTRVMRPRVWVYGVLLLALAAGWTWGVAGRSPLIVDVQRDRNALYRIGAGGEVENGYTLKLVNKIDRAGDFTITIESPTPGIILREPRGSIHADAEEVLSLPLILSGPSSLHGRHNVKVIVNNADGSVRESIDSTFFGPM